MTPAVAAPPRREAEWRFLSLTADGRITDRKALDWVLTAAPAANDCFVFCHGWLHDEAEARHEAARFFALLETALAPVRERVTPLRLALHWPSRPFADAPGAEAAALLPVIRHVPKAVACTVLSQLCDSEVPASPEEEAELAGLRHRLRHPEPAGASALSPVQALSFWLMKRRAGQVGERVGRELLSVVGHKTRLHLIGHSFGGRLVASAVLGGAPACSLTLLLAAFSAFAFAREVPGFDRPGAYHPILAQARVHGPIVVLRSAHDRADLSEYPVGRDCTNVSESDRVRLVADPEALRKFVTERVDELMELVPAIDQAVQKMTRR